MAEQHIAVAGAGPVGLTVALLLARQGHDVTVFEARSEPAPATRASTLHPPTLDLLDRLGILAEAEALGRRVDEIHYYRCTLARPELAARFPFALLAGQTRHPYRLHLEQALLTPLLLRALGGYASARVVFQAEVAELHQHDGCVEVVLRQGREVQPRRYDWLVGADGMHSAVRAASRIAFDDAGDNRRVLRVTTPTDLRASVPGLAGVSYLYDDEVSVSLLEMRHTWRVQMQIPAGMSDAEACDPATITRGLERFMRLSTPFVVGSAEVYQSHRRVAASYRAGNVLLAGDAAHITNARGGMNLNCGLHDAWALAEAFTSSQPEAALDDYASTRRQVASQELIPRTVRMADGGFAWLAAVERISADAARATDFVRASALLDIAPRLAG